MWTTFVNNPLVQLAVRGVGLYVLALYLAMVFWTVRDAQQRTENPILPYLAGLLVVVLNILGLFLYLIVRPKETLGEAYERQLAEESLLAEAEQRVVCPTCKERVQEDYILCPTCRVPLQGSRTWGRSAPGSPSFVAVAAHCRSSAAPDVASDILQPGMPLPRLCAAGETRVSCVAPAGWVRGRASALNPVADPPEPV